MNEHSRTFRPVDKNEHVQFGTDPVPTEAYHKPEYFDWEREAVFRSAWLQIGRVSEVAEPKDYIVREVEILNASVLISHGKDGRIRAFHNVCTHRGTKLVWDDGGKANKFSCRYHMWTFGLNGSLQGVPDADAFYNLDKANCGLTEIALEICAGFLFINFDPQTSLREFLGGMAEKLEARGIAGCNRFAEYRYEVGANWKLTYDNFQEVYHLRWVHEKSVGGRSTGPDNPFGYPPYYIFDGSHRGMGLWFNPEQAPGPVEAEAQRRLSRTNKEASAETEFLCLFPNIFLFASAGRYFTQQVWPIAVDRTRSVIRIYWTDDDGDASERFGREFALAATIDVHSEDRSLIEAGQQGLGSGAIKKIHFQAQEVLCRHFFHEVDTRVQAYRASAK